MRGVFEIVNIRRAHREELAWINKKYDEIGFQPSVWERDLILVAEDAERAGIGRLVKMSEQIGELGGIYVFPRFQGKGVARNLVLELLRHHNFSTLYCLPFAHLTDFYKKMGFRDLADSEKDSVPEKMKNKMSWCYGTYGREVRLLVKKALTRQNA
jgi:N-acetylglutamate synthase-like GNAT family acetyltransferase